LNCRAAYVTVARRWLLPLLLLAPDLLLPASPTNKLVRPSCNNAECAHLSNLSLFSCTSNRATAAARPVHTAGRSHLISHSVVQLAFVIKMLAGLCPASRGAK